jgi:hypothetical protein
LENVRNVRVAPTSLRNEKDAEICCALTAILSFAGGVSVIFQKVTFTITTNVMKFIVVNQTLIEKKKNGVR